ncbi:MAG TPA: RNA polymerase sigma factor [Polyangiaceae bacterium]
MSQRSLQLLAPFHDAAIRTARRLCRSNADGDDLFQEAVLRANDRLSELRDPSSFRSWFFAILLTMHRRRHRRDFWRRMLPIESAPDRSAPPEADALDGAQRMARALAVLSPEEREAIVLFELEGFTLDEIAALQRSSLPAVKSRLSRARARLRHHYEKDAADLGRLAMEKNP